MEAPDEVKTVVAIGWRRPAACSQPRQAYLSAAARDVVRKDRADTVEELHDADGGVVLHLGAVDRQQCGANLRGQWRAARAERNV
jgi:hypothetical protein